MTQTNTFSQIRFAPNFKINTGAVNSKRSKNTLLVNYDCDIMRPTTYTYSNKYNDTFDIYVWECSFLKLKKLKKI